MTSAFKIPDLPRSVALRGSIVSHVPGDGGFPACREGNPPPVYAVERGLPVPLVLPTRRCTAAGCAERWGRSAA